MTPRVIGSTYAVFGDAHEVAMEFAIARLVVNHRDGVGAGGRLLETAKSS